MNVFFGCHVTFRVDLTPTFVNDDLNVQISLFCILVETNTPPSLPQFVLQCVLVVYEKKFTSPV